MNYEDRSSNNKRLCEVFVNGVWESFDGHGVDTDSSREWYSKNFVPFAQGSFPLRYNGVVNSPSAENSIFYKRHDAST